MRRSGRDLLSRSVDRESLRDEEIKAEIEREFCTPLIPRCVQATSLHSRPTLQTYGRLCLQDFPRQEFGSALPRPPPGDLPTPGIEPVSSALQADSLPPEPPGKPWQHGKARCHATEHRPSCVSWRFLRRCLAFPQKRIFKRRCHSEPSWAQVCIRHETPQARLLPGSPPDPRKLSWRRSETKVGRPDTKTYKDNLVNLTWPRGRVSKEPIPQRGSQMTRGVGREPRRTFQGWPT